MREASDSTRSRACATSGGTTSWLRRVGSAYPRIAASGVRRLVAGVGDEAAHPLLAGLADRERVLDVADHRVDGGAHLPDLGAGVGLRHADVERDLPARQRGAGHLAGGPGHRLQRSQAAANQQRPADAGDDDEHAADDHDDEREWPTVSCTGPSGRPVTSVAPFGPRWASTR
ncbi:hypothetical protein GCM10025868_21280 [Angustibacter aerolatus]|uniref:Uncharacterized protein n=1 Tax=Angustibacter aerolatus TaxID=1162965 RepID=A0ABQ6JFD2_9ACTN|nr:hypothetical protein [Angustibacter aerolatus]GMA86878.1 hypothetical protein GCM10025868_21280 [Angustibacter aerolatus]